jgi:hypothetical protein
VSKSELSDLATGLEAAADVRQDQANRCSGSEYAAFRAAALVLSSLGSVVSEWVERNK